MVRHTLKILQQMLQDFKSEPDHFGALRIKGSSEFKSINLPLFPYLSSLNVRRKIWRRSLILLDLK